MNISVVSILSAIVLLLVRHNNIIIKMYGIKRYISSTLYNTRLLHMSIINVLVEIASIIKYDMWITQSVFE